MIHARRSCISSRLLIALLSVSHFFLVFPVFGASAFKGFYTGLIYLTISGAVTQPEQSIGAVAFTIDENGAITSSGDLSGSVDTAGTITWKTPNGLGFATGSIARSTIIATSSQSANGITSTYRISAKIAGPGFAGGSVPPDRILQVNPVRSLSSMNRIRFLGDRFVAVGRGAFAISEDGLKWSLSGIPTTLDLYDVAYGNGTYVVVGDAGAMFTSPDGSQWTSRSSNGIDLGGVAFGNGVFVSVNLNGAVSVSSDGVAWSSGGTPISLFDFPGLDFLNNQFVLWRGTQVSVSSDGKSWSAPASHTAGTAIGNQASAIKGTYGNGVYVIGGFSGVAYSANASTWTKAPLPTGRVDAIGFGNGRFVIQDAAKSVWTSTNGSNWTRATAFTTGVSSIAFGKGKFAGVGGELYVSTDGLRWERPETDSTRLNIRNPDFSGSGSNLRITALTDQFFSIDPAQGPPVPAAINAAVDALSGGKYWVGDKGFFYYYRGSLPGRSGIMPPITDKDLRAAVWTFSPAIPVIVAGGGGVLIRVSGDGSRPILELQSSPTSADLLSGVSSGLGGPYGTVWFAGTGGTIIRSADVSFRNWAIVNSGTASTLRNIRAYTPFDHGVPAALMLAVGDNGTILSSPDGGTWTVRPSGTTVKLVGSVFQRFTTPKRYLVAGEDGTLLESTNGLSWKATVPLPAPQRIASFGAYAANGTASAWAGGEHGFIIEDAGSDGVFSMNYDFARANINGAALGNGRWVFVGGQATVSSTDGQTWASRVQSVGFEGVAFGQGRFVGVGQNGIGTSGNGLNWIVQTNPAKTLQAVAFGGGRFAAVGVNAIMISDDGVVWKDKTIPGANYRAITWSNGVFVAVGAGSARSTDNGDTWTSGNLPALDYSGVAFGNGRYVAVGWNGATAYSDAGSTWTTRQQQGPTTAEGRPFFRRVTFVNGTFMASTLGGEMYTSADGATWSLLQTGINGDVRAMVTGNGFLALGGGSHIHLITIENLGAPSITTQPTGRTINAGASISLSGAASGASLSYQWLKDGQPLRDGGRISGATTSTLAITDADASDSGVYELGVSNPFGTAATLPVVITVNGPPVVIVPPPSVLVPLGGSTNLAVVVVPASGVTFQWRLNGRALTNGTTYRDVTSSTLSISNALAFAEGGYDVIAASGFGSVTSRVAQVTVARAPSIVVQPTSVAIREGQSFTLEVAADGTPPLTYRWRRNSTNIVDGSEVSGAATAALIVQNATLSKGGGYSVVVSNLYGAATSLVAQVSLIAPGAFRPDYTLSAGGTVWDIEPAGNGEFLVGGDVSFFQGQIFSRVARINAAGSVNTNFQGSGANTTISSVKLGSDGKVMVGGNFFTWNNNSRLYIARLNANGSLDTNFASNAGLPVVAAVPLPDGRVIVGRTGLGVADSFVTRYLANGAVDPTFTEIRNVRAQMISLAVHPDGSIWFSGAFGLKKANPDGTNPVTVDGQLASRLIIGTDRKIYHSDNNGQKFTRRNPDGSLDASFNIAINGHVSDLAILSNQRIVLVGDFNTVNSNTMPKIAYLESTGSSVPGFSSPYPSSANSLNAIADLGDGSVLVGGDIQITAPISQRFLQRVQIFMPPSTGEQTSFDSWKKLYSFIVGINDGPGDDPDRDSLPNFAEFQFGTDPTAVGSGQKPGGTKVIISGKSYAAIQYTRNPKAAGGSIQVRASNSITFAAPVSTVESVETLGGGLERVTVRSSIPLNEMPAVFFVVIVRKD